MLMDAVENKKLATSPPNGSKLFDKADMLSRMDGDHDFVGMILEESSEELQKLLEVLIDLCRGDDAKAIRIHAHTMKGMAANISAAPLRDVAARIESAAMMDDLVTVWELLPELERTVVLTVEAIR